jgi:hypothetical protein
MKETKERASEGFLKWFMNKKAWVQRTPSEGLELKNFNYKWFVW